jgi:hypothetical protein
LPIHLRQLDGGKILSAGALLITIGAARMHAQSASSSWYQSAALGATVGGTWQDGDRAPRIRSGLGAHVEVSALRAARPGASVGATLRVNFGQVSLDENGSTWEAGSLIETALLATMRFDMKTFGRAAVSLDFSGGPTVLTEEPDISPFRDAPPLLLTGELGVSIARVARAGASRQRQWSGYVRYSAIRLRATGQLTSSGTVGRVLVGVRRTR